MRRRTAQRMLYHVESVDGDCAGRGVNKSGEHLEHGALAGTIGANKANDLALIDGEADLVNGGQSAVAAGDRFYANHVRVQLLFEYPAAEHGSTEIGIGNLGLVLLDPMRSLVAVGHRAVRHNVAFGYLALH